MGTETITITEYNPYAADVKENPYPYYSWLREEQPVYHIKELDMWAISRHDDVLAILRNYEDYSSSQGIGAGQFNLPTMLTSDPPEHTRLRALVKRAFAPSHIAAQEQRVRAIVEGLLDDVMKAGKFDLIKDLAEPLPIIVISEMLGVEPDRRSDFKVWSKDVMRGLGGIGLTSYDFDMKRTMRQFWVYIAEKVKERKSERRGDLISILVSAQETDESLSTQDIFNFCLLLLVAGNETTTNLMANTGLALLDHEDQANKLWADTSLAAGAIEEGVRYDTPVQGLFRTTTREMFVQGTTIPANAKILLLFGAANRDASQFSDPDTFDIGRGPTGHVGFGRGIHFCLGASLAKLEARVAIEALARRMKNVRRLSNGSPDRLDHPLFRGLKSMPLRFDVA